RSQCLAVRSNGQTGHNPLVAFEPADFPSPAHVPKINDLVMPDGQDLAVRRESQRQYAGTLTDICSSQPKLGPTGKGIALAVGAHGTLFTRLVGRWQRWSGE